MTVYVLVAGSNYVGTRNQLGGCENDVDTTVQLHQELGHQVGWLKGTGATRQAILNELDAAYDQAGPDDLVWFKWSGHGTQVRDADADENDPWDEAICPDDSVRHGGPMLTDDDLYGPAVKLHRPAGGSMIERLDNLIHHPRLGWVPRPLTSWVCDVIDHKLGMTWAEIRRARHGKVEGYTNQLDWRTTSSANNTLGEGVVVHYKTGERA